MNATNNYDVCIRDYYRMTLYLVEKAFQLNIPEDIRKQDSKELLDPLFNADKIGERPIMNTKVDREEGDDINHRARHVIRMIKDWIKKPFPLDPIPDTVISHAHANPERGGGKKVKIHNFVALSPIRPEMVYQLDQLIGYYHPVERKGNNKRKRTSPQRIQAEQATKEEPPQQQEQSA